MKDKRYYIAYGSNLSVEQMAHRCPDAKIIGTAVVDDYALLFKGCATIEPRKGKQVPVLVWEISPSDEKRLDRYEGYPSLYYKKDMELTVRMAGTDASRELTAMVYIMDERCRFGTPTVYYYQVMEEGYKAFHFPEHILAEALEDSIGKREAGIFLNYAGRMAE